MENCCDSMLKYLIFIVNFFFFVTGVALVSMGAYVQIQMSEYFNFLGDSYLNTSIVFIVLGVVILIIGFFGCCGACTENHCMVFTYATLLALVVIVEIGAAIAIYIFKNDAKGIIENKMKEGLNQYQPGNKDVKGVTDTWDAIQKDFKCCGVNTYENWGDTTFGKSVNGVPDSCCKEWSEGCGQNIFATGTTNINTDGCLSNLEKIIVDNVEAVIGIGVGIIVVQILGVLISCMLANNMRRRANYV